MIRQTPLKTIRAYCLQCAGGYPKEVRYCSVQECPLHFYRFGTNPHRQGVGPGRIIFGKETVVESAKIAEDTALDADWRKR